MSVYRAGDRSKRSFLRAASALRSERFEAPPWSPRSVAQDRIRASPSDPLSLERAALCLNLHARKRVTSSTAVKTYSRVLITGGRAARRRTRLVCDAREDEQDRADDRQRRGQSDSPEEKDDRRHSRMSPAKTVPIPM